MKNWKTNLFGALTVLPQILALFPDIIQPRYATAVSILFAAMGLAAAKDFNVSGNPPKTIGEDVPEIKENNLPVFQSPPPTPEKKSIAN